MSKLYIMNGPEKGKAFDLDEQTTCLGRISSNDIQIREKSISRHHLEIIKQGDVFFVPAMEWHQFVNTGNETLKFLCVIPYKHDR